MCVCISVYLSIYLSIAVYICLSIYRCLCVAVLQERERERAGEVGKLRRVRTETRFICEEEARRATESLVLFYTEMKRERERERESVCPAIRREIQERVRDNMGYYKRTGRVGREGGGTKRGKVFSQGN